MTLSAGAVAVEGLRLVRREPVAVGIWALAYLALVAAGLGLLFAAAGPMFGRLMLGQFAGAKVDPAELKTVFKAIAAIYILALPFGLMLQCVLIGAIYRAVLRPQDRSFWFLRLGADEFRLLGVNIVLFLVFGVALIAAVGALVGLTVSIGGIGAVLFGIVAWPALFCLLIFLGVRLCLATPMTFAERRMRPFACWGLTREHFWSLFGAALLAFLLSLVINVIVQVVMSVTVGIAGQGLQALLQSPSPTAFTGAAPVVIIYGLLAGIAGLLQMIVWIAPLAAAYRTLVVDTDATAETFA